MAHNEVKKLFCNSLAEATKDIFYRWIFFCTGGKEAALGGHSSLQPTVLTIRPTPLASPAA